MTTCDNIKCKYEIYDLEAKLLTNLDEIKRLREVVKNLNLARKRDRTAYDKTRRMEKYEEEHQLVSIAWDQIRSLKRHINEHVCNNS
jgi:hypothetical protein